MSLPPKPRSILHAECKSLDATVRIVLDAYCRDHDSAIKLLTVWLDCVVLPGDSEVISSIQIARY
jgi:hypothetical protein